MNELLRECQSLVSCLNLFQEPGIWHRNCPESMPDQLPMGDQYISYIISDVNAEYHIIYSTSNNCRSKKAGEKRVHLCYNNVIPIPSNFICYKRELDNRLWKQEYVIMTDNVEIKEKRILSNKHNGPQDIDVR